MKTLRPNRACWTSGRKRYVPDVQPWFQRRPGRCVRHQTRCVCGVDVTGHVGSAARSLSGVSTQRRSLSESGLSYESSCSVLLVGSGGAG